MQFRNKEVSKRTLDPVAISDLANPDDFEDEFAQERADVKDSANWGQAGQGRTQVESPHGDALWRVDLV